MGAGWGGMGVRAVKFLEAFNPAKLYALLYVEPEDTYAEVRLCSMACSAGQHAEHSSAQYSVQSTVYAVQRAQRRGHIN